MHPRYAAARRVAGRVALAVGLLAAAWTILLLVLGGGFDTRIAGLRIRSNDPFRTAVVAIGALTIAWLLLRSPRTKRLDVAALSSTLRRALPLIVLLAGATLVRVWALGFGFPSLVCRPDEEALAAVAGSMYFGDLKTHYFTYPPLSMLAVAAAMRVVDFVQYVLGRFDIHPGLVITSRATQFFIARVLSAAAGVCTVGVVFNCAKRLFGRPAALASAACLAFAFLHVRDSHFGVTDVPMTFMLSVAFLWVTKLWTSGRIRDLAGAAIFAGLATATKYNAAIVAVPAMFAILANPAGPDLNSRIRRCVVFLALMLLSFLVISPYTLVERQQMLSEFRAVAAHLAMGHGPDLGRGWTYHLTTTLRYGLGLPLLISGLAGLVMLIVRQARTGILVALFPVVYYIVAGSARTVFTRHMEPIVPFLCMTAGYAITEAAAWMASRSGRPKWAPAISALAVAVVLWPSAFAIIQLDRFLMRTDTRVIARQWIDANVAPGTTIAQRGSATGRAVTPGDSEPPYALTELTEDGPRPAIVIVQWSPLHHSDPDIEGGPLLKTGYDLRLTITAAAPDPANVYDWQDDFYLPMSGFKQIERPGPNLRIYVHKK